MCVGSAWVLQFSRTSRCFRGKQFVFTWSVPKSKIARVLRFTCTLKTPTNQNYSGVLHDDVLDIEIFVLACQTPEMFTNICSQACASKRASSFFFFFAVVTLKAPKNTTFTLIMSQKKLIHQGDLPAKISKAMQTIFKVIAIIAFSVTNFTVLFFFITSRRLKGMVMRVHFRVGTFQGGHVDQNNHHEIVCCLHLLAHTAPLNVAHCANLLYDTGAA